MRICGAVLAMMALLAVSPGQAQEAAKAYWVCSIMVPTSLEPPVIDTIISTVFQDQTIVADVEAARARYAAAILVFAKAAGHSLASGALGFEATPTCMAMDAERRIQEYRLKLFAHVDTSLALHNIAMEWTPEGAVAVASDPVPPLPPATKPGRIGVTMDGLDKHGADLLGAPVSLGFSDHADGALLSAVEEGGAAHRSGLQMMDVVLEIAGQKIETPADLIRIISAQRPGTLVPMSIVRFGEFKTMQVLVGE